MECCQLCLCACVCGCQLWLCARLFLQIVLAQSYEYQALPRTLLRKSQSDSTTNASNSAALVHSLALNASVTGTAKHAFRPGWRRTGSKVEKPQVHAPSPPPSLTPPHRAGVVALVPQPSCCHGPAAHTFLPAALMLPRPCSKHKAFMGASVGDCVPWLPARTPFCMLFAYLPACLLT